MSFRVYCLRNFQCFVRIKVLLSTSKSVTPFYNRALRRFLVCFWMKVMIGARVRVIRTDVLGVFNVSRMCELEHDFQAVTQVIRRVSSKSLFTP